MKKGIYTIIVAAAVISVLLSGCAGTLHVVNNLSLTTKVKTTSSIMLNARSLAKNKTVFVKVTNTSEMQEIDISGILKQKMTSKGYTIVEDPSGAGYVIGVNVLFMDYIKDNGMSLDMMLAGAFGGGIAGSGIGRGLSSNLAGAGAGVLVGGVLGALAGSLVHVDNFAGVVDVRIDERTNDGIMKGTIKSNIQQGISTSVQMEREVTSDYVSYATKIAARATRTNIDRNEAAIAISEKIATQITAIF